MALPTHCVTLPGAKPFVRTVRCGALLELSFCTFPALSHPNPLRPSLISAVACALCFPHLLDPAAGVRALLLTRQILRTVFPFCIHSTYQTSAYNKHLIRIFNEFISIFMQFYGNRMKLVVQVFSHLCCSCSLLLDTEWGRTCYYLNKCNLVFLQFAVLKFLRPFL